MQGEHHKKMKAGSASMRESNAKDCQQTTGSWETGDTTHRSQNVARSMEHILHHSPEKEPTHQHLGLGLPGFRQRDSPFLLHKPPSLWHWVLVAQQTDHITELEPMKREGKHCVPRPAHAKNTSERAPPCSVLLPEVVTQTTWKPHVGRCQGRCPPGSLCDDHHPVTGTDGIEKRTLIY